MGAVTVTGLLSMQGGYFGTSWASPTAGTTAAASATPLAANAAATVPKPSRTSAPAHKKSATTIKLGPMDWPAYLRNAQHTSGAYSVPPITLANVANLQQRWSWSVPTVSGRRNGLLPSPTVAGGRIYIGGGTARFYALNAQTGKVVWWKQLDGLNAHQGGSCGTSGITSTAAVARAPGTQRPTVYVAGGRYLYAFDATTGAQRWKHLVGPPGSLNTVGYRNWSSPTVAGGVVLMGLASNCDRPWIRGGVQSFDQRTGALKGSYFTVPAGKIGGSVWSSLASDGKTAWVSTGNPDPTGTHAYDSYSIVRLSLPTLKRLDIYRVTLPIDANKDFGSSPTVFHATIGGKATRLVGACNKNGVYYVWRSDNLKAGPVWQDQIGNTSHYPDECITSSVFDYQRATLYIAANSTTINGEPAAGAVRRVDPATGAYGWQTPLPCVPLVSPSLNGSSGLLAVSTWCTSGESRTYVLNTANGAIVASYVQPGQTFTQPVWAGDLLLIGGGPSTNGKLIALG